jgi:RimJ/RimL family protein N-acetyltransferase
VPSFPELTEPLSDGNLQLRPGAERDIPEILIAHQDDPELYRRIGLQRPPSGAELGRLAEHAAAERAAGRSVSLTIVQSGSDRCCGRVEVHQVDWENRRADLGVWIAPALRSQGLARGALRLATGWLFDRCRLERLQLLTEPDNEPMLRSAQAAGFAHEGVLRGHTLERGERVDAAILSLLPDDPRE